MVIYYFPIVTVYCGIKLCVADIISTLVGIAVKYNFYGAQNEAYMSRSAEKWVRGLCFNELGVSG